MKQTLQLQQTQQLSLTPQLQQAIKLLQLSTTELQETIETALLNNPLLERTLESETEVESESEGNLGTDSDFTIESPPESPLDINMDESLTNWDWDGSYSPNINGQTTFDTNFNQDLSGIENLSSGEMDLTAHLLWQLQLTPLSPTDATIAMLLIDSINEDGYLTTSLKDIQKSLKELDSDEDPEHPKEYAHIEIEEIHAVLHRIQQFDPIGVGARDLVECLKIQLTHLPPNTPYKEKIALMIESGLPLLAQRDFSGLKRKFKLNDDELKICIQSIQALNPKPGADIGQKTVDYVVPDIFVYKRQDAWQVELNPLSCPQINVNQQYSALIRGQDSGKDNQYLKEKLQEARWFIKSLENRNETIIKVAKCIVEHQVSFLENGPEAMKPLVLSAVADAIGVHESTVSRVTTNKYMHTPRGTFELKRFFSSHVGMSNGGVCSATAIQAHIQKWVDKENKQKPLSDLDIANLLMDKGIQVARRTIAKYREQLGILPSHERKKLF